MYNNVPQEMKEYDNWCCYSLVYDEKRGKDTKVPLNPKTGTKAMSNNPKTWGSFQDALDGINKFGFSGLGFMFSNSPFLGIDIDGVSEDIEKFNNGNTDNIISEFMESLETYTEYSPSGTGIHLIAKGDLPPQGRRKGNVEMYTEGRFFTVTGNNIGDYGIKDVTETVRPLHGKYIGGSQELPIPKKVDMSDLVLYENDILDAILRSKQADTFKAIYSGNWQQFYTSQSEADMGFCNMLAFWCRCDISLMDNIFRSSGLYREKWDRKQNGSTYGAITLSKAVRDCNKVYEPQNVKKDEKYLISIEDNSLNIEKKVYTLDDTGNAEKFNDMFGEVVKYSYVDKEWIYYDGRCWRPDNLGKVNTLVDICVNDMDNDKYGYIETQQDTVEAEKAFYKHVKSCRSNKSKVALLKEAQHRMSILPSDFDTDKMLLNTLSGVLHLKEGKLYPHGCDSFITKVANVDYTQNIDCPLWEQFLMDIFDNDLEMIDYIQKALGYSLTGETKEQAVFFAFGNGSNGKSVFLDVVSEIMGDYATNIQPETILQKGQQNSINSDIARLKGARFVTSVEPDEGLKLKEGLLKQLTGGDKVTARKLYGNEFEFKPEFKLWMGTNHKPIIRGTDLGIWRRIHLIPFTVTIPDEKKDKDLTRKLRQEKSGILNWIIEGCLKWQKEGLKKPNKVEDAVKEYKGEMDVISSFIDECCIEEDHSESIADIYKAYTKWASLNNEYMMPSRKFSTEIKKRYNKVKGSKRVEYRGIKILDEWKDYKVNFTGGND